MQPATIQEWKAQWIWAPTDDPTRPNTYFYFRKAFKLEGAPKDARLCVSADTYYRLFINGRLAGWGPVMTEPRWQTFDTYDVTDHLRTGENVIGAIVFHHGNAMDNADGNTFFWSRGGFLCQLDLPGREPITSDGSWKTLPGRGWKRNVPKIDRSTFAELFDARKEPVGWLAAEFDDDRWENAQRVTLDAAVAQWNWNPLPSAVFPWLKLEPRPMKPYVLEPVAPLKLLYAGEVLQRAQPGEADDIAVRMTTEQPKPFKHTRIDDEAALLDPARPAVIHPIHDDYDYDNWPGIHDACFAFDAGRMVNARIRLEVTAPEGAMIDIGYAQILVDGRVIPYLSHRTPVADQFIARGGRQVLETFLWRNFRYAQLTFRNLSGPLTLHRLDVTAERYPFERVGAFECNDEALNWTWKACIDTTELCIHDRFMDNPFRERRAYVGDLLSLPHGIFAAFDDLAPLHKYYSDMQHAFFNYGMVPHTLMGNRKEMYSIYVESPLELILHHWRHWELYGDRKLLKGFYPLFVKSLELIEHYADERGLVGQSPFTMFVDWAEIERRGTPLVINVLLAEALRIMACMAREIGRDDEAAPYQARYDQLRGLLPKMYWNAERGVFIDSIVDGRPCAHTSEHVNFLMMMFDLASDEQCAAIARAIENPGVEIGQVEPSFIWATEGLFRRGQPKMAVDLIRHRYQRLRRQGLETIAELWNLLGERFTGRWRSRDTRSAVQGSGVSAAYLLGRYVLGIRPATPGFGEALIAPEPAGLEWARGAWPSPRGPIAVEWRCEGGKAFTIACRLPDGMTGRFVPPREFAGATWSMEGRGVKLGEDGTLAIRGGVTLRGERS